MFRIFFLCTLLTCFATYGDEPRWELKDPDKGWADDELVLEYFHNSELQRQWAWELIGLYPLQGDERILDFGCGDGKITAQLSHCVPQGEIIGLDLSQKMISFAKRSFPNRYYPSLSFICSNDPDCSLTHLDPPKKFDKIYSFFVFHLVPNPQVVLSNLRNCVSESGQLLLVTPRGGNKPFFEAASRTFKDYGMTPPWKKNKTTNSEATMRSLEGIKEILTSSGWEISYLNDVDTPYCFVNRAQFIHWMIGTIIANWNIPKEISASFFNRLVTHMIDIDPQIVDEQGVYYFHLCRTHIVALPK